MFSRSSGNGWLLASILQVALASLSLLVLTFSPGELGRTLLLPVNGAPIDRLVLKQLMLQPVAPGPLRGSLIVNGRGRSLAPVLFNKGIIMLAAPAAMCGGNSPRGTRHDD